MKSILLLLLFFSLASANAQERVFLRVYNAQGKKINKGHLFYLSDTSITLARNTNIVTETPVSQIYLIKSKRTTGHRILAATAVLTGVGVIVLALVWVGKKESDQSLPYLRGGGPKKNESIKSGTRPKPFKRYKVDGNAQNWQQQKAKLALLW